MAQINWEADKMLDIYIYDYLLKRNLQTTAKAFMAERKVSPGPVAIDAPGGFLLEWWSIFWDIFIARTNNKHSEVASEYIETPQITVKEYQQQLQMQQLQFMQQQQLQLQRTSSNYSSLSGPVSGMSSYGIMGPSTATALAAKNFEERLKHPSLIHSKASSQLFDPSRLSLPKSPTSHSGPLAQGNAGAVSVALQQIQARNQQTNGINRDGNLAVAKKSLSLDPSLIYNQGFNENVNSLPLNGWPLTSNRKRKQLALSGATNTTYMENTSSPNSQPSASSRHTTMADGMVGNVQNVRSLSKGLMMYGTENTAGLAEASSNQMDDWEHIGCVGSLEDPVESFLSDEDGDARGMFASLKRSTLEHNPEPSKGFTFNEIGCLRTSSSKVVCCHFSSDGKLLASAGHEKKVVLWNMETLQTDKTSEVHTLIITDVRFRPGSTQLATSSFDKTVRLWNAAEPSYCLNTFTGHSSQVTSVDFHPNKTDLLCSCDGNGEIRFWNVKQYSCSRVSKGGTAQVRFQPRIGQLLAAAAEKLVNIFDLETDRKTLTLQGHSKEIHDMCWDTKGEYLASVSQDCVKVWSLTSGDCVHELSSNGSQFHSCVFHPCNPNLLVIGGYQCLELWNMVGEKETMTVQAHDGLIPALAQSAFTGMVASASHDKSVKLWK